MKAKKLVGMLACVTVVGLSCYGLNVGYNKMTFNSTQAKDSNGNAITVEDKLSDSSVDNYMQKHKVDKPQAKEKVTKESLKECYNNAKKLSHNVVGWLYVDGTNVDYPIMSGESTNYWLNRNWQGKPSASGSIFLDTSEYSLNEKVLLIHGHDMKNGSMFASVRWFAQKDFFNANHVAYIYDGTNMKKYKIFSVFKVDPNYQVNINITTDAQVKEYAENLAKKNIFGARNTTDKQLLFLNTCMSDGTGKHQITIAQEI